MMQVSAPSLLFGLLLWPLFGQPPAAPNLDIFIKDVNGHPISGVRVQLTAEQRMAEARETDDRGHVSFSHLSPGRQGIVATKAGFETVERNNFKLASSGLVLEITMVAPLTHAESIE